MPGREDDDFEAMIAGVRAGEPRALHSFYERYGPSLERLAARAIAPGLRRRFGPESIAQSVCRSFVMRARADAYELTDAGRLWRLLCAIAISKVRQRSRHHLRQRRGVQREVHGDEAGDAFARSAAGAAGPEEEAVFRERFQGLLDSLDDEERRVLELCLDGRSQQEIADELAVSRRTVRRVLARVEQRFERAV